MRAHRPVLSFSLKHGRWDWNTHMVHLNARKEAKRPPHRSWGLFYSLPAAALAQEKMELRYRRPGPEPRVTSNQHRQLIATTRVQSERTRVSRAVPRPGATAPDSSRRAPRTTTRRRPPSYANASHRIPAAPARQPAALGRSPGLCRYAGILSRTYIPTPEEQAARRKTRQEQREDRQRRETTAQLSRLKEWGKPPPKKGRPSRILPPHIAQIMLQDLAESMGYREIIKKYAEYQLSLAWISRAVSSGDLERMSRGESPGPPVGEC